MEKLLQLKHLLDLLLGDRALWRNTHNQQVILLSIRISGNCYARCQYMLIRNQQLLESLKIQSMNYYVLQNLNAFKETKERQVQQESPPKINSSLPTQSEGKKILSFIGYTFMIYLCFLTAGLLEQRIYKVPYLRTGDSIKYNQNASDYFTDKVTPLAVTSGIGCIIAYLFMESHEMQTEIPMSKFFALAGLDVLVHITLIAGMIRTSYVLMIMANTCSLLSVVLVGAYCSGVKETLTGSQNLNRYQAEIEGEGNRQIHQLHSQESQKIGADKIGICGIVCLGIFVFAYFSPPKNQKQQTQNPTFFGTVITLFLFTVAVVCEGFRPDLYAQIKQTYSPSPLTMFFNVSRAVLAIGFVLSAITLQLPQFVSFAMSHDQLLLHLTIYGGIHSIGHLFVYKLITIFRQHIFPMVSTVRKCFTVCLNIIFYGRHVIFLQWIGIFLVFGGIMVEIISNYNLAEKILPKNNIRKVEGGNYNKIVAKQDENPHVFGLDNMQIEGI